MSQIRYLLFAGKMQVGKTTSAQICTDILFNEYGYEVENRSFAFALKETCRSLFRIPWSDHDTNEDKNQLTDVKWDGFPLSVREKYSKDTVTGPWYIPPRTGKMTRREVWQVFGSDIIRGMVDKDLWAKMPFLDIFDLVLGRTEPIIVTLEDTRFPNEIEQARKHDSLIVKLIRNTGNKDNHVSETALDNIPDSKFDLVIDNNGTLDELDQKLSQFIEEHF